MTAYTCVALCSTAVSAEPFIVKDGAARAEIVLGAGPMAEETDPLLGISGRVPTSTYPWYINVCRQRVRGDDRELSAWSTSETGRFNVPERFGKVYIK